MNRFECSLVLLFAGLLAFQILLPPTIGTANNGDYAKMIGRFALGPLDPANPDETLYYEQRWRYRASYRWVADNYSSELALIAPALAIGRILDRQVFDLRILGVLHALLWTACFAAALPLFRRLSGRARYALPILAVVIAFRVALGEWSGWLPFLVALAATVLLVSSKPQHGMLGLVVWILPAAVAAKIQTRAGRWLAGLLTCLVPAAALVTVRHMPEAERQVALCQSLFGKFLKHSRNPEQDLRALGLSSDLKAWIEPYRERSAGQDPLQHPELHQALTPAVHRRMALHYLRHPGHALRVVYDDLGQAAPYRRPPFLGNYQRSSGLPPRAPARSFHWWSDLRSAAFIAARWHVLVWYALFTLAAALWTWRERSRAARLQGLVTLTVALAGALALPFACLGDDAETDRHLWLFHVITDLTMVIAASWCSSSASRLTYR